MSRWRRIADAIDDRTGLRALLRPIFDHKVPPGSKWWYVFGSATLLALVLQVVTGIVLSMNYIPSTGQAYDSLRFLMSGVVFGRIVRGMHYFGASAVVILIGLHAIRVFLMGAYKYPREMNWLTGALLMPLVLGMAFTGQLLRWDQNGFWSVIVMAEQASRVPYLGTHIAHFVLSGDTVGGVTLSHFYALHVFILPALVLLVLAFHLYLVLHNGISEPPRAGHPVDPRTYRAEYAAMLEKEGVPFWPDAAWRDATFGFAVIAAVVALACWIGPPALGTPPNPTVLIADPRPDWYLLWYFAVLALTPPKLATMTILLSPIMAGIFFLALPFLSNRGERSPLHRPWAVGFVLGVVMMIAAFWRIGVQAPWSPDFTASALPVSVVGTASSPVAEGALLFHSKGCQDCHAIAGLGGRRGPDLSRVADRLGSDQITIQILDGKGNMPAFAAILKPSEVDALVAFLETRSHR